MEEYKSNSFKSRQKEESSSIEKTEAAPVVKKVVIGATKLKKKPEVKKLADVFLAGDIENVKSYMVTDVLVPAIKKTIFDVVTNGIDMILYGENGRSRKNSPTSKVSYGKFFDKDSSRKDYRQPTKTGCSYDDIIFETRGDAEAVLDAMNDILSQYGVVSVADLYDLSEITTDNFTVNKYGWTDISGCRAIRVRDGYILKLPKAIPIN